MKIDLGEAVKFEVSFSGKMYSLREPTVKDIAAFQSSSEEGKDVNSFINFVVSLGLPQEIAEQLGVTKLKRLADGLLSELQEKK